MRILLLIFPFLFPALPGCLPAVVPGEDGNTSGEKADVQGLEAGYEPAEIERALSFANDKLYQYIAARQASVWGNAIMGPNFDGAFFYRLGKIGTDGAGMSLEQLRNKSARLTRAGFPAPVQHELDLIALTGLYARKSARPDVRLIVKHFPGGTPRLELTERYAVHFEDAAAIAGWLRVFQAAFNAGKADGVMLSHCTYDRGGFPGIASLLEGESASQFFDVSFEETPASLNPVIVRYLREVMGYHGPTMGDWYNMRAVRAFAEQIDPDNRDIVTSILAIEAGVDRLPGFFEPSDDHWEQFLGAHPEMAMRFDQLLNQRIRQTYARLLPGEAFPGSPADYTIGDRVRFFTGRCTPLSGALKEACRAVIEHLHGRDPWNRIGILALLHRQWTIQHLTGMDDLGTPPLDRDNEVQDAAEVEWFNRLMSNTEFRELYNGIAWTSSTLESALRTMAHDRYGLALDEATETVPAGGGDEGVPR